MSKAGEGSCSVGRVKGRGGRRAQGEGGEPEGLRPAGSTAGEMKVPNVKSNKDVKGGRVIRGRVRVGAGRGWWWAARKSE